MKRYLIVLAVLICAGCLWSAQTNSSQTHQAAAAQASPTPPTPSAAPTPDLPGDTVVITIHNVCDPVATPCETKITKAEFDELYKTFGSKTGPPAERTGLAEKYVRLLVMAEGGIKDGVDKTPEGQEQIRISRLSTLAQLYQKKVQEDSAKVSEEEVKKYYEENVSKYEEITVRRIMVPRITLPEPSASPVAGAAPAPTADAQKRKDEEEAATKALAEKARKQLVAGADPEQVEKDVYAEANSKGTPPSTQAMPRRHGNFPANEEAQIFQLKPGEISEVLNAGWAFEIYKVESKSTIPLEKVQDEIKKTLSGQKMKDSMQDAMVSANPEFNDKYFTVPPSNTGAVKPTEKNVPGAKPTPPAQRH